MQLISDNGRACINETADSKIQTGHIVFVNVVTVVCPCGWSSRVRVMNPYSVDNLANKSVFPLNSVLLHINSYQSTAYVSSVLVPTRLLAVRVHSTRRQRNNGSLK